MKSICFYSSYFTQDYIPYYVKFYLEELEKHFTEIIFLTNEKQLQAPELAYLKQKNISLKFVSNEGFDFGMWYKAFKEYKPLDYDRVGLINDSCVLFKPLAGTFNWINSNGADYCGLVSSKSVSWHIQSYFIIINKNAIKPVYDYFMEHGLVSDYKQVIYTYEIGLSANLRKQGLKVAAMFTSKNDIAAQNPSFLVIEEFIRGGIPMIKKKIIFRSFRKGEYLSMLRMNFKLNQNVYIKLIKEVNKNTPLINFDLAIKDFKRSNKFDIYIYSFVLFWYRLAKRSKLLTALFHKFIIIRRRLRGDTSTNILAGTDTES
ncbi:MAG TPA: rhamnan synthesis F family protein [Bacteroidia bacterium]|nr:rhamnan synthesis F family protein [Bacteroidia bacterium]